jgi:hypothetical protein
MQSITSFIPISSFYRDRYLFHVGPVPRCICKHARSNLGDFAIGFAAMSAWGFTAAALTRGIFQWTGFAVNAYAVFSGGMIAGPSLLAALVLYGLCRAYDQLNPIEDIPR